MRERLMVGVACGIGAGALWGLVFLAPQLLAAFTPLQLAVARYLSYGAVAALVLAPRARQTAARMGRAEWWALVRLSLLGNLIYYVLLGSAVQWAGSAATALIIGLLPVVVTVIGTRAAGAVQLRRLAAPCLLCVIGVALVALDTLQHDSGQHASDRATRIAGLLCAFGALASWSAYSIVNARWLRRRPDLSGGDWSLLTGVVTGALALVLAPAALIGSATHVPIEWAGFWGISLLLGILASVIGNALWNRASRVLPLTLVGQMIVFETIFALLYGFAWEMRLPTPLELAAITCLLVGVLWCAALHAEAK
ncbi:DMT family transporter [Xanthomonas sp. WHRI 8391]|uniref:Inner membrane protein YtfF n=1 Tax=Xanthomonas hortorum pv. carotae TaxID=487904 RepID=A0A6V7FD19_9XANT|nr:DMT family transporter [Xanthomonas hortorum]ETC89529.1 integral membrane protein [Xanthomonas hortorum pv. carotae str. M081]MBG3852652.1 DMT family transporter [Xanthomonas hortorum pv. carotae]UTS75254.1 DMT family transporter [Xanthomonas hortorum]CAD0361541.1 Inner membrane protein YtfF [Xanthomonas hortorum pv. carotae]CAD0361543.1 Inner membrane protein YtfF [Xanthomonas hortorum pv. carotae]